MSDRRAAEWPEDRGLAARAAVYAAVGEPARLAIVDELAVSDRSPKELAEHLAIPSNLLAHHLDVLEAVGLITRAPSASNSSSAATNIGFASSMRAVSSRIWLVSEEE